MGVFLFRFGGHLAVALQGHVVTVTFEGTAHCVMERLPIARPHQRVGGSDSSMSLPALVTVICLNVVIPWVCSVSHWL